MKKTVVLQILICLSVIISAQSCKKSSNSSSNNSSNNTPPAATYTNRNVDIALIDYNDASHNSFGLSTIAYLIADNVKIDSLTLVHTNMTNGTQNVIPDACAVKSSLTINSKAFKTKDGSTNYIDIYDGSARLVRYQINYINASIPYWQLSFDNSTISTGSTVYGLPCQSPNLYGAVER